MMEKENIIIQYISVWSWHIVSIIFLVGAFIIVFSGNDLGNNIIFIVFLGMFILCESIAYYRKKKLEIEDIGGETEDE